MKQLLIKLTGFFFSTIVITGCKHDDIPVPQPVPPATAMVKKLVASASDYVSYQYTADNKLASYTISWLSSPDHVTRTQFDYTYNSGKLLKAATAGGWIDYHYSGNQVISADNFVVTGRKLSTEDFVYDNKNQLVEIRESIEEPEDVVSTKIIFSYKPDGNLYQMDNLVKKTGAASYELVFSKVYEQYDNKTHPVPGRAMEHSLPGVVLHKNNPLRVRTVLPDGSTGEILHMTYQYNGDGSPVSREQHIEINGHHYPSVQFNYQY